MVQSELPDMKILFVSPSPWPRTDYFAEYAYKKGNKVLVLSYFSPKSLSARKIKHVGDVNVVRALMIEMFPAIILNITSFFLAFLAPLIFWRPNIIIFSAPPGDVVIGPYFLSKMFRKKIVFDVRDEWEDYCISTAKSKVQNFVYRFVKKVSTLLYLNCDSIMTETPAHFKSLQRRGLKKITLVPNGADVEVFYPLSAEEEELKKIKCGLNASDFVIVYSGGIGGYYRLDVIVKALKVFKESNDVSDVKFVFIGRGEVKEVLRLANKLGLSREVMYFGVKHAPIDVAEVLACADVGVVPYDGHPLWKNTYPTKFFEYCACGIPVIATAYDDSILAKLIEKHEIGFVAPPMDVKAVAEAIEKAYFNKQDRETAGERARRLVEKQFDRAKTAEKFLELLHNLCEA